VCCVKGVCVVQWANPCPIVAAKSLLLPWDAAAASGRQFYKSPNGIPYRSTRNNPCFERTVPPRMFPAPRTVPKFPAQNGTGGTFPSMFQPPPMFPTALPPMSHPMPVALRRKQGGMGQQWLLLRGQSRAMPALSGWPSVQPTSCLPACPMPGVQCGRCIIVPPRQRATAVQNNVKSLSRWGGGE